MTLAEHSADEWFVSTVPRPDATVSAVAFPHAGGGCSAFAMHARAMPAWLRVMTVNLPGRQARFGEPLRTDIGELTQELTESWAGHPEPCLFFGYCSGAMLAYCVVRGLQERGAPLPRRLVVGGYPAPHLNLSTVTLADLDSENLWKVLIRNQAIPPHLGAHSELRKLAEPVIRADLALVAGYRHTPAPPLPIPITVLIGSRDVSLRPEAVTGWADYTTQQLQIRRLPTGHWFMEEDPAAATAALVSEAADVRP
ncbi:MAG TPA: thioesterase domain-containing protein [Streptosporangiaceae bacterium]|nr:thioesterase domain-containing protein [Streptosporangiaceae bacterium]